MAVDADWTRSYAVKADGTVWGWGGFYYRDSDGAVHNPDAQVQLNGLENIVAVSAGYGSFIALKSDETVWYYSDQLNQVKGVTDMIKIAVGAEYIYGLKNDVVAIQASPGGPLMLKQDGTVWASGDNAVGNPL